MNLQKRLAAQLMKCSPQRIVFDTSKLTEIKDAITKFDIRGLINKGVISRRPIQGISKFHARKIKVQKKRGRRKGCGSRKGTFAARADEKFIWMNTVRAQRSFLKKLKSKKLVFWLT